MTSSSYFKNETKSYKESFNSPKYNYDSDVIEIINLNDSEPKYTTIIDPSSCEKYVGENAIYNKLQDIGSDIEVIEDISNYNYEKTKLKKIKEYELSNEKAKFIKDEGVFFEYYLGCIESESIILSSEVNEIKNGDDIYICYEISPKTTKRSYSPMYTLKINNNYVMSNDYIRIVGRNISTNTQKSKKKKVTTKKRNSISYNDSYEELQYDTERIISADKKFVEFEKCRSEVLKDIYEGYACIRIKHNNRDVSKLKSDLSKTLSVLLVLNAIKIEIELERVPLNDIKFGGSLKTFIHVILYPDAFKIDSHKFHEYNSLIKYSVNNLFKELKITPLRLSKIDEMNSFENSNYKINKDDLLLSNSPLKTINIRYKKDKNANKSVYDSSGFCTPHRALGFNSKKTTLDLSNLSNTKEEEIIDILSENEIEEEDEKATNLVFVEEKYRGGYLLEDFEEIYPNNFYFKPKLKTYQAEGIWWMYTRENPPEYSNNIKKQNNIKEIIIDESNTTPYLTDNIIKSEMEVKVETNDNSNDKCFKNKIKNCKNENIYNLTDCKNEELEKKNDFNSFEDTDNDLRNKNPLNPLWEEYAFIPNIKIYEREKIICVLKYFYINKLTGAFSLTYPQYVPPFRGGILADEMGLGKTIQSIGLITHDIYTNNLHLKKNSTEYKNNITHLIENTIRRCNFNKGGTLVIAPLALLYQWKQEIERHTKEGFISSYIYYGGSKDINSEELSKYFVVLTTYSTLVSEYKNTLTKRYAIKEDNISKNKQKNSEEDTTNKLNQKKLNNFFMKTVLSSCNVSSDNTVKSSFEKKTNKCVNSSKESPLYEITWRRILIDEAHVIKNKNSIQSIAVWKLRGERKWCLTGTPIQNSILDIFPLLRFLGIKPYGTIEWWNKEIVDYVNKNRLNLALDVVRKISSPILLRRTKQSKTKDGNYIISLPKKNIHLEKLEFSLEEEDFYRAVFYRSKTKFDTYLHDGNVLSHYSHVLQLLLRLRQCCSHPLLLFSKPFFEEWNKEDIISDVLKNKNDITLTENKNNIEFFKNSPNNQNSEEDHLINDKKENNIIYNFILGATKSKKLDDDYINELEILKNGNAIQCAICLEDAIFPLISKCLHIMCKKCADSYFHLTQIADKKCPQCDHYINLKSLKTLQENKSPLDELLKKMKKENFVYSTKLKKVFEHIQNDMKNELHIVVFSQWIGFLKIIQKLLTLYDIPNKIYDGSLTYEQRKTVLHWFNIQKGKIYQPGVGFIKPSYHIPMEDIAGKVLLCSLKAGGVGLNLTVSSKVYLMDLWWNPAVEDQAFERVHRIGQLKDVDIYKFVLEKTVEERILQIHQNKQYTANQILTQEGNKITTEVDLAPQKLGMDEFILMFKDWNAEE